MTTSSDPRGTVPDLLRAFVDDAALFAPASMPLAEAVAETTGFEHYGFLDVLLATRAVLEAHEDLVDLGLLGAA